MLCFNDMILYYIKKKLYYIISYHIISHYITWHTIIGNGVSSE